MFSTIVYIFFVLLIIGTILVILTDDDDNSSKKIAWIIIVTLLPVIGLTAYLIIGLNPRRTNRFKVLHEKFSEIFNGKTTEEIRERLFGHSVENKIAPEYQELARLLSHSNGTTVSDGNEIEIITSGQRKFEALMRDLENARKYIHLEYFYFRRDSGSRKIKELLMKKAREGVKVRFIHENIANIDISPRYYNEMKKAGVEVVKFTRSRFNLLRLSAQLNYRDHRKIAIIDGKVGYTGGMNIGDDYFLKWRDTHLRITGNAVAALQYSFLFSFISSGGKISEDFTDLFPSATGDSLPGKLVQIVPDEPDDKWPIIHMGAVWAVQHSSRYVYIQTPYFVPPEPLMQALKAAALKGTDVRIMMPQVSDSFYMDPANKSHYQECLDAGIRIYEKTGSFIHSKTIVSDDYLSIVGSANMDFRSLELNYEINAYIYDRDTALENRDIFLKDLENCCEILPEQWKARPWYKKLWETVMRLFAPLL